MSTPSKEARVLKFFIDRAPGSLGVTQLLKLAYLADLFAREYLGRPITRFRYTFYRHGPFDRRLYSAVREMEANGWTRTEHQPLPGGKSRQAVISATDRREEQGFTEGETRILEHVARTYGSMPLERLLGIVYATDPMKVAQRDTAVPMDIVNGRKRNRLGYDLDAVLSEEREIARGNYLHSGDFFNAIRAEIVAGDAT